MMISTNNYVANAFSTVSISPAVSSLLSDPTLLGDGISSSGDSISSSNGEKKTFDVLNPGASLKQYNDGSSSTAIARLQWRDAQMGTQVHPADLDDALRLSVIASSESRRETRLPFAVDSALLHSGPGSLWAVR